MRLFPDGKFVFLWRNPLSVMASIVETFYDDRWYPTLFRGDLFIGLPRLISAYLASGARVHSVRFEDLIGGDELPWRRLMKYLELEFQPDTLRRFAEVKLDGRMGDKTGVKQYSALSTEPAQKWKRALANPLRKAYARKYVQLLGCERLAAIGYDHHQILAELDSQPTTMASLAPDLSRLLVDVAKEPVRVRIRGQGVGGPNVIRSLLANRRGHARDSPDASRRDRRGALKAAGRHLQVDAPSSTVDSAPEGLIGQCLKGEKGNA